MTCSTVRTAYHVSQDLYHDTPKKCMPVWDVIDTPHEQSNVLSGLQGFSVRSPSNISLQ